MAFGPNRNQRTVITHHFGAQRDVSTNKSYLPNPHISVLLEGFNSFVKKRGMKITASQQKFINTFFSGANVLLSGEAGTGKSFIIKILFEYLNQNRISIARTASTGIAAFNIGGQTMHSFFGIGLGEEDVPVLVNKILKNKKVYSRIKAMDVLFIDEVSMCKGELFEKLDQITQRIRACSDPWGGVQLIGCGDFLQLLPIFRGSTSTELVFQTQSWLNANIKPIVLKEQVRQQDDPTFARILGDLRVGKAESIRELDHRIGATFPDDGIEPVRIFCKNVDVNIYNEDRLDKLKTAAKVYYSRDTGLPHHIDAFNKNCPAPQVLNLKIGAQVILLANVDTDNGLVNGAVGVVQAFGAEYVKVKFKNTTALIEEESWEIKEQQLASSGKLEARIVATRAQIPLKLCWAITCHRSQGQTLDRAIVDMTEAFSEGMTYVALSRVRDINSLSIVGEIPHSSIRVNQECLKFYQRIEDEDHPF